MASPTGPGGTEGSGSRRKDEAGVRQEDDLDRRRKELEASLAASRPAGRPGQAKGRTGSVTGYGQALKLSSEFIAGIAVGVGIGWLIDELAGTSPWGLIVFLLLGFGAGVLNVMRSAGMVTDAGLKPPERGAKEPDTK